MHERQVYGLLTPSPAVLMELPVVFIQACFHGDLQSRSASAGSVLESFPRWPASLPPVSIKARQPTDKLALPRELSALRWPACCTRVAWGGRHWVWLGLDRSPQLIDLQESGAAGAEWPGPHL